jgi:peptidoglycan/xylan/chitin deacetylase (PgdA/CDA1 family)
LGNSKLHFRFQRCHWYRWNRFSRLPKRLSRRIRSHMRNGFSLWVRALGGVDWWKKTRGRKSRDTVPLRTQFIFDIYLLITIFSWKREPKISLQTFSKVLYRSAWKVDRIGNDDNKLSLVFLAQIFNPTTSCGTFFLNVS